MMLADTSSRSALRLLNLPRRRLAWRHIPDYYLVQANQMNVCGRATVDTHCEASRGDQYMIIMRRVSPPQCLRDVATKRAGTPSHIGKHAGETPATRQWRPQRAQHLCKPRWARNCITIQVKRSRNPRSARRCNKATNACERISDDAALHECVNASSAIAAQLRL